MRFSKWHALGNSYLLVERAELGRPLNSERARLLCDVRYGIGSDGLLEIVSDEEARAEVAISVSGREYRARSRGAEIEMEVGPVEVRETETIDLDEERIELTRVSVGNPHAVVRLDADRQELLRLGPLLERHERFVNGTNVQLVTIDGVHDATALVWERGAGETSASGSSAVAVAAAATANGWCESPVTVHMPGGDLRVEIDDENRATLIGPAQPICTGETAA